MRHVDVDELIDDDVGSLRWVAAHSDGFVLNTYCRPNASYLRLHRASCGLISGTPANGARWTSHYIKIFGDAGQLRQWANDRVGGLVWDCARCAPAS